MAVPHLSPIHGAHWRSRYRVRQVGGHCPGCGHPTAARDDELIGLLLGELPPPDTVSSRLCDACQATRSGHTPEPGLAGHHPLTLSQGE